MENKDFTTTILVEQTPEKVFEAINNVRGWWSEQIAGNTNKLNEEFKYNYKDVHISKMKIVEFVTGKKVVWLVLENHFQFTKDKTEWVGNKIIYEISEKDGKTQLKFTHKGLVPAYECYKVCFDAWTSYIHGSLKSLITTGQGKPNPAEGGLNEELIEKFNLPKK
ncbi:MAG: SRPBCC domain-containing protein [Bacteroidetes bacterium]|nr:SRPBCC domain-containing protein [Bacteroidota bacterium]